MNTETIRSRLVDFEQQHDSRVLFAVESGSRAWGFASPDSDFDVRAVFVRPLDRYLAVTQPPEDYTRLDGDFDLGAWDLRKFLRLLRKSNATPAEWLQSPIRYAGDEDAFAKLLTLAEASFQPRTMLNHYRGLARQSWGNFDAEGYGKLKKFFYVLRPLLAARWIAERRTVPPMAFAPLRVMLEDPDVSRAVDELVLRKREVAEGHVEQIPALLREYVTESFAYLAEADVPLVEQPSPVVLDDYFRSVLQNPPHVRPT